MSNLMLNEQVVPFNEFYGENRTHMPKLIAEGRTPLSVAGLMKRRLEVLAGSSSEVKEAWWDNYFDTGDGVFYHPEGNLKVVLDAQPIRDLTLETSLLNGAVILGEDNDASIAAYEALDGVEFKRSELECHVGKLLTKDEAKAHPLWNALAGGDQALLNEYVDAAFAEGKQRFGKDKLMDVCVSLPYKSAVGCLWLVDRLYDNSRASRNHGLNGNYGRLVGVAPEALAREK